VGLAGSRRPPHVGKHEVLQADRRYSPGRVDDRLLGTHQQGACRSVWLSSMTSWPAGRLRGSRRGPVSRWCDESSASISPASCTRESTSTTMYSQTRSRSDTRWEEKMMLTPDSATISIRLFRNSRRASGSRLLSGSSRMSSPGAWRAPGRWRHAAPSSRASRLRAAQDRTAPHAAPS